MLYKPRSDAISNVCRWAYDVAFFPLSHCFSTSFDFLSSNQADTLSPLFRAHVSVRLLFSDALVLRICMLSRWTRAHRVRG